jgi:uncharacterized protein YbjT (DUF2867 family)
MSHTFRRPTILVIGASGAQGGSVARHLLADGRWTVRAFTREPTSSAARTLRDAGVEIAVGDLGDFAGLRDAMAGCHGVYGVTSYWEHFGRELQQGHHIVEAAAETRVRHLVLHTRPDYHGLSRGELAAPQCDLKAAIEAFARARCLPATFVRVAFYYENLLARTPLEPRADGGWQFGFPQGDVPLAAVSADDVGGVVAPIFARRDDFLGRTVGIVGDERPCAEYAQALTRVLARPVTYAHVPREQYAARAVPGAAAIANMFDVQRRFMPSRAADLAESRALFPRLRTLEQWAAANVRLFAPLLASTPAVPALAVPTPAPAVPAATAVAAVVAAAA